MRSPAQFETEWGYHSYAGMRWLNPHDALRHALTRDDDNPEIDFVLPAAETIDWTAEPEQPVAELYRQRAQRLREEYDYLVLMYSGGSDSHQAMMAFINAGVPLDEVHTAYPVRWCDKVSGQATINDPLGLLYEFRNAAMPGLAQLSRCSPRTIIRTIDTSDAYTGDMDCWLALEDQHRTTGGVHGLFQANFRSRIEHELRKTLPPNKRVGVIYGVDKPHLTLDGSDLLISFLDHWRMGVSHLWGGNEFEPVMFYWGDLRIPCKQAHMIRRALQRDRRIIYDLNAQRRIIYPDWCWFYQAQEAIHVGLLRRFAEGRPVDGIAAERTRYLNQLYAKLPNVHVTDETADSKRKLRFLFARDTKFYLIGEVNAVSGPVDATK